MRREYDFLLVGQGIAGTVLGWHLRQRGYSFLLTDAPDLPAASRVAAGIFNPLTGRKLVKTWRADTLFPYAAKFYTEIAAQLDVRLVHQTGLYRPFRSPAESNAYLARAASPEISAYIAPDQPDLTENAFIHAPYNGLSVTSSGWVDIPLFLDKSQHFFAEQGQFLPAFFDAETLQITTGGIQWKDMHFSKVILCQGTEAQHSSLFSWLPFNPVKGQLLEGFIPGYNVREIVNQGIFILPLEQENVRVGATYSWHDMDQGVTDEAKAYLLGKLAPLLKTEFRTTGQKSGIRPSTSDRRPFIGMHPRFANIGIFNGFGTKGVTLAPYFAGHFVNYLEKKEELDAEVNIARHFSLYFQLQNA